LLGAQPSVQEQPKDDTALLRSMWAQFEAAFNARDAKSIASLYAPDADRINPAGEIATGRAAIQRQYEGIFARLKADPSAAPLQASIKIRFLRRDVAILDGSWRAVRSGQEVRGQFTVIATKEGGEWRMIAGRDQGLIQP
jgi:uncharacterized protein (TIGR02246 family)